MQDIARIGRIDMYTYNVWQWFLFFYIYCFLGWCWETSYVSIKMRAFQNRGFMNGPFLPIYGSGAMVILIATLPVEKFPILVFLFGMIAATLLELFTGMAMESIFHMRYWDYSYRKIQYKGHICLVSSIAWGVFSCLMIYGFHRPIENMVLSIPDVAGQITTMTLTIICVSDFSTSFKTAIDLKNMLMAAENAKAQIEKLERRAEIIEVFLSDSIEKNKEEFRMEIESKINDILGKVTATKEEIERELASIKEERKMRSEKFIRLLAENKSASNLLKRNPNTVSKRYKESLSSYRDRFIGSIK